MSNNQISQETLDLCYEKLDMAQLQLIFIKGSVFTTTVISNLKILFTRETPTADVDGLTLRINPDFWLKKLTSDSDRVFILAHEAWHVLLDHIHMFDEYESLDELGEEEYLRRFGIFNQAADHAINLMLKNAGYRVPSHGLQNSRFAELPELTIYREILDDPTKSDPNFTSDVIPSPKSGNGTPTQAQQELKQRIDEIIMAADTANNLAMGTDGYSENVPDSIKERIADLRNPQVPWREVLANFMFSRQKTGSSFKRPNRRYLAHGMILPTPNDRAMNKITIAIDVSGSVSDDDFNAFMSEVVHIAESLNPKEIELIQWHHGIADITTIEKGENVMDITIKETGGTNVRPMLEHCIQNEPDILVVFTDGYYSPFSQPEDINFPSIWAIYDNPDYVSNVGDTLHFTPQNRKN